MLYQVWEMMSKYSQPHFRPGHSKAQRDPVTCLRSHSTSDTNLKNLFKGSGPAPTPLLISPGCHCAWLTPSTLYDVQLPCLLPQFMHG